MRTIDVGICHDNDRMVTQLRGVVIFFRAGAESRDHEAYFLGGKHFVEARFFHVEDFTLERKDRLIAPVAALLGRAAGGIALDEVEFAERGVPLLAVSELAGKRARVQGTLTPC